MTLRSASQQGAVRDRARTQRPGTGGQQYLEGTYSEVYSSIGQDKERRHRGRDGSADLVISAREDLQIAREARRLVGADEDGVSGPVARSPRPRPPA